MIKPVLAIVSPNQNVYSETFIQAHKGIPDFDVKFYYNGAIPQNLEGYGALKYRSSHILGKAVRMFYKKLNLIDQNDSAELLKRSFKKENVRVVLAEYGPTGAALVDICQKMNIRLVVHFHGYDAVKHELIAKYTDSYRKMFAYASTIISVSNYMTGKLIELGCPERKILFNSYGASRVFHEVRPTLNEHTFIAVGRFVDKKAPYYTLLAFKEVLNKFPNARLIMAGDGMLKNTIENLVKYFNLKDNVMLPGIINQTDFINYLKNVRAFVQHSIIAADGDMEGTPVGIIEACTAGVPVISTMHAGIPDVIQHYVTGLLCDEHDVKMMTENMLLLLENKQLAIELGTNARKFVNENYALETHLKKISTCAMQAISN
jgi:colanic acid/amylovoran biosynthesis glycosyltransferase